MAKIKKGDTVRLKSGGPLMTVKGYDLIYNPQTSKNEESDSQLTCQWFDENDVKSSSFDENMLDID